mgnify:CR=1 FL=1
MLPKARIWVSSPTWENHAGVFKAAGLEVLTYPYYDAEKKDLEAVKTEVSNASKEFDALNQKTNPTDDDRRKLSEYNTLDRKSTRLNSSHRT